MTPENSMTGLASELDWLGRWNLYSPNSIALFDYSSGKQITYKELYEQSLAAAQFLRDVHGVMFGDRVAILSKNHWSFVPLFFALQRLGAILVPINFRLKPREVQFVLNDSKPKVLLTSSEFASLANEFAVKGLPLEGDSGLISSFSQIPFEKIPMSGTENDVVMILYTSGTTGVPKGAMVSRKMLFWNSVNTSLRLNLTQSDVHVAYMPFFHTGGWNVLLTPFLHHGAKTILLDKFDPDLVLALAEREQATILFAVPTMMDMMAKCSSFASANLSSVRYAVVGGEPMPLPLIKTWVEKGIPIRQGYGLTEFGPNVFSLNEEDCERKMGSIGFPNFYINTRVIDDQDRDVADGEIGELILHGPTCTPGYWNHPDATAQTIRSGWLHTGDLVRRDDQGYFYVVGRKKDMFISGGENVYPAEVENCLREHEGVSEAAVIGVPDAKWGEVGRAYVVLKPHASVPGEEILAFCRERIAKFKVPKDVRFLPELPKGDSGKVLKRCLRELEQEQ